MRSTAPTTAVVMPAAKPIQRSAQDTCSTSEGSVFEGGRGPGGTGVGLGSCCDVCAGKRLKLTPTSRKADNVARRIAVAIFVFCPVTVAQAHRECALMEFSKRFLLF